MNKEVKSIIDSIGDSETLDILYALSLALICETSETPTMWKTRCEITDYIVSRYREVRNE